MDETHFAALCRALGSGVTRRGALGVLTGVLGQGLSAAAAKDGAANGLLGGRHGKNRRGRNRRKRRRNKQQRLRKNERGRSVLASPDEYGLGWPSASDWARCEKFRNCRSLIYGPDRLVRRDLHGADLHDCNLCGVDFRDVYLGHANLQGANLLTAKLTGAAVTGVQWSGADLHMANLYGVVGVVGRDLDSAHFCRTIMTDPSSKEPKPFNYFINDRDCNVPIGVPG